MSNSISPYSKYNGISGLVSGLDTEELVKKALASELAKVNRIKADKQMASWRQESYHSIMDKITAFTSKYYDVMNTDSYFFSAKNHKKAVLNNLSNNADSFVELHANSSSENGSFVINSIEQLATSTSATSGEKVINGIKGATDLSFPLTIDANTSFRVIVDGDMKEINIEGTFNDASELVAELNTKFNSSFGTGKVVASVNADNNLILNSNNSVLQVVNGTTANNFLSSVGIDDGKLNIVNVYESIEKSLDITGDIKFKINNEEFSFTKDDSMKTIMNTINSSKADVVMTYSSLNDTFTIKSKSTGATSEVNIENLEGDFFGADSVIKLTANHYQNGEDAIIYLNDPAKLNPVKRSSNDFNIDGINFTLKKTTNEAIDYTVTQDTEGMVEKIKEYVEEFNTLISDLSSKLSEKIHTDYQPLTDEQREDMSENQIKLWEEKAKSGMHRHDKALEKLVEDLKGAFYQEIEGATTNLYKAGISTSNNFRKFEISIDETKLKEALKNDSKAVFDLFSKDSDIDYTRKLSSSEYSQRHKEIGFARRVSDIMKNNMSTMRDNRGFKGVFVELAGVDDDASQDTNDLTLKIKDFEDKIKAAIEKMGTKEKYYWDKFTALETALQRMNTQSSWIMSQFSK